MPLPLISARPPSALSSTMRDVGAVGRRAPRGAGRRRRRRGGGRRPRARGRRRPAACRRRRASTRKSLPRPWCLVRRMRSGQSAVASSDCSDGFSSRVGSAASSQRMRGSRRNHARCRRAKRRVRRTARSTASSRAQLAVDVGEQLLVAEGLAGGARQPGGSRGQARAPRRGSRPSSCSCVAGLDAVVERRRVDVRAPTHREPIGVGRAASSPGPND